MNATTNTPFKVMPNGNGGYVVGDDTKTENVYTPMGKVKISVAAVLAAVFLLSGASAAARSTPISENDNAEDNKDFIVPPYL